MTTCKDGVEVQLQTKPRRSVTNHYTTTASALPLDDNLAIARQCAIGGTQYKVQHRNTRQANKKADRMNADPTQSAAINKANRAHSMVRRKQLNSGMLSPSESSDAAELGDGIAQGSFGL